MNLVDKLKIIGPISIFAPLLFSWSLAFSECKIKVSLYKPFDSSVRILSKLGNGRTLEFELSQTDGTEQDIIYLFIDKKEIEKFDRSMILRLLSSRENFVCISYYEMWEKNPDKIEQEDISPNFYSKREIIRFNRIWYQLQEYMEETMGYINKYRDKMRKSFDNPYFDVG